LELLKWLRSPEGALALSILLKSYWNGPSHSLPRCLIQLSILLKSYWNRIEFRVKKSFDPAFNSPKVLLELGNARNRDHADHHFQFS